MRIRLENNPLPLVGVIAELRPDTLLLALPAARFQSWRPLPFSDIAELNVSGGHRRRTLLGVLIGGATGLIATATYNGIVQSQCFNSCPDQVSIPLGIAVGGAALGGAFYFIRVERWSPIAVPGRRSPGE